MRNLTDTADHLAETIANIKDGKLFRIISAMHGDGLPLVAWQLIEGAAHWDEFALARTLRQRGWILPAYSEWSGSCVRAWLTIIKLWRPRVTA